MKYCDNLTCMGGSPDDSDLERIDDYVIVDGAVLCAQCAAIAREDEEDEEWLDYKRSREEG